GRGRTRAGRCRSRRRRGAPPPASAPPAPGPGQRRQHRRGTLHASCPQRVYRIGCRESMQVAGKDSMDKLVITVAVDSTPTYPNTPFMPSIADTESIARQYVDAVNAGASICHHHGRYSIEPGADGRSAMVADLEGFQLLTDLVRAGGGDPIVQYGTGASL